MTVSDIEKTIDHLISVGAEDRTVALKWLIQSVLDLGKIAEDDWKDTRLIDLSLDKLGVSYHHPLADEIINLRF